MYKVNLLADTCQIEIREGTGLHLRDIVQKLIEIPANQQTSAPSDTESVYQRKSPLPKLQKDCVCPPKRSHKAVL